MADLAQLMREAQLRREQTQQQLEEQSPSLLSRLFSPANAVFDAINYVDATTRAGVGRLAGVKGTGEETVFGPAPSGRELLGLGPGRIGQIESGDIPGFLAEVAISPLNLFGLGAATKTGQIAADAAQAARRAEALSALGKGLEGAQKAEKLAEAAQYANVASKLRSELLAAGKTADYGATLGEQARRGQRSLLSLDVPFTDINVPLVQGDRVLDALGATGRAAAYPFKGLAPVFRRFGQAGAETIADAGRRDTYNAIADVAEESARQGRREGSELSAQIARFVAGRDRATDAAEIARINAAIDPLRKQAISTDHRLIRLGDELKAATTPAEQALVQQKIIDRTTELERQFDFFGQGGTDASQKLLRTTLERGDVPSQITEKLLKKSRETDLKIAEIESAVPEILKMRDYATRAAARLADPVGEINKAAMAAAKLLGPEAVAAERNIQKEAAKLFVKRDTNLPGINRGIQDMNLPEFVRIRNAQAQVLKEANERITNALAAVQTKVAKRKERLAQYLVSEGDKLTLARGLLSNVSDDVLNEANRIRAAFDGRLSFEIERGSPVKPLADPMLSYVQRVPAPEALDVAAKIGLRDPASPFVKLARETNPEKGFVKKRIPAFDGLGITQINDWFRREAAAAGIKFDGNYFVEDLSDIALRRMTQGGLSVQAADLIRGAVERFHAPKGAVKGMAIEKFLSKANLGRIGGVDIEGKVSDIRAALKGTKYENAVVPHDVANAALKTFEVFNAPKELKKVGDFFSKYNALMRFWVTIPFPGYHFRNAASNVFQAWLAGMHNVGRFTEAARLQAAAKRALLNPTGADAADKAAMKTIQKAVDLGAMDATLISETVEDAGAAGSRIASRIGQSLANPGSKTPYVGRMAQLGHWIENNAKLALYLDGIGKDMTPAAAAERVKKYLFNYGDLSRIEKDHIRKWAFFYSFQRKNLPLMFERLFADPRRMRAAGFAFGYTGNSDSEEFLTEYQKTRANLDTRITDADGNRIFLNLGLPIQSLFDYGGERKEPLSALGTIARKVVGNVAPALQIPLRLALGSDPRSGQAKTAVEQLTQALPTSRFQSSGAQIIQAATGDRSPLETGASLLLGIGTSRISPDEGRSRRLLEMIDRRKEELKQRGQAGSFTEYYGRDPISKEEINRLSSLASKIREKLRN